MMILNIELDIKSSELIKQLNNSFYYKLNFGYSTYGKNNVLKINFDNEEFYLGHLENNLFREVFKWTNEKIKKDKFNFNELLNKGELLARLKIESYQYLEKISFYHNIFYKIVSFDTTDNIIQEVCQEDENTFEFRLGNFDKEKFNFNIAWKIGSIDGFDELVSRMSLMR